MDPTIDGSRWPATLRAVVATLVSGALTTALTVAAMATGTRVLPQGDGPVRAPLADVVGLTVLLGGLVAAALLTLGSALLVATTVAPARRDGLVAVGARRLTPALLRRAVAVGLGAGLGIAGPVGLATAAEIDLGWAVTESTATPPEHPEAVPVTPSTPVPAPASVSVSVPVLPAGDGAPGPAPGAVPHDADADRPTTVVVAPGDSLWSIAAAHLPPGASDVEIAAAWPRWYEENRAIVGVDPDLIHAGQQLDIPVARAGS